MSSNKSMAVWCTPQPDATPIELDIHFNYWRLANGRRRRIAVRRKRPLDVTPDFVEIGLMFDDARKVASASIFIPTVLGVEAVSDCTPFFMDAHVVQGIFNERLDPVTAANGLGPLMIRKPNQNIFCRMHRFTPGAVDPIASNELTITPYGEGTLIVIQEGAFKACLSSYGAAKVYFRLRIDLPMRVDNPFVEKVGVPDGFLNSGYDQIDYLDFRLNEARTLPTVIENRMALEQPVGSVAVKLVAFLTAVPVQAEISVANTEFHKMRLLEYPIWSGYAPGIPRGMVVYHWKRLGTATKPIHDFSAFVKLQTRVSGGATLSKYLLFAFAFGVFGNLFASYIEPIVTDLLKPLLIWAAGALVALFAVVAGWSAAAVRACVSWFRALKFP